MRVHLKVGAAQYGDNGIDAEQSKIIEAEIDTLQGIDAVEQELINLVKKVTRMLTVQVQ